MGIQINPVKLINAKKKEVAGLVAEKSAQLVDPFGALRMTVIAGLQGDIASGNLDPTNQKILDDAGMDSRKLEARELLLAADDIMQNIDAINDVEQAFIDRGV